MRENSRSRKRVDISRLKFRDREKNSLAIFSLVTW